MATLASPFPSRTTSTADPNQPINNALGFTSAGAVQPGLMTTGAMAPVQPVAAPATQTMGGTSGGFMTTGATPVGAAPAGSVTTGQQAGIGSVAPTSSQPMQTMGGFFGGIGAAGSAGADAVDGDEEANQAGWNTVYRANRDLGPQFMDQYGWAANQRLAELGTYAINASAQAGQEGSNIGNAAAGALGGVGQYYGDLATSAAQQAGNQASMFGQYYGNQLAAQGADAAQAGRQGMSNAIASQGSLVNAGQQAAMQGAYGGVEANSYANNIAGTAQLGTQAAQQAQAGINQGVGALQGAGAQAVNIGQQGAQAINQASQGIGAAGQAGVAAGVRGENLGLTAAQQGQQFLNDSGYQQNLSQAEQARRIAQGNATGLAGIESQEGPSAAQAQLRAGLNQAQSANLAMARSGRGLGGGASALRQASVQNAQAGQQAANQSAILRAQEDAAFRQRQAANLGSAANIQLAAGQQAAAQQQQLHAAQLAQTEGNRQAYLQSQGLGLQGAGLGMQGAGMGLTAAQAQAAAAAQAAQTGLAGVGQNVAAQQAAMQGLVSGGQMGLAGANQALAAQQAAAQANLAGNQLALQGAGMNIGALQAGGQLGVAGSQLAQQGIQNQIGAQQAASQSALQGILGGGELGLSGITQGGQMALGGLGQAANAALAGNAQNLQGIGQATTLGLTAEQQQAANTQYSYGLTQQQIQNMINIAQGQAGLNVQNANMMQQGVGAGVGAAAMMLPLLAMSDVRAKEDIVPLSTQPDDTNESWMAGQLGSDYASQARAANLRDTPAPRRDFSAPGADPYGIDFAVDQQRAQAGAGRGAGMTALGRGSIGAGAQFAQNMQSRLDPSINPVTGQPWGMISDVNSKTDIVPLGAGRSTQSAPPDFAQAGGNMAPPAQASPRASFGSRSAQPANDNMMMTTGAQPAAQADPRAGLATTRGAPAQGEAMMLGGNMAQPAADPRAGAFGSRGSSFDMNQPMGGGMLQANPVTGQPLITSDKRSKYYATSDKRAKESAGEMVEGLDPYAFRYKDPERHGQGVHYGIMAQDLERSPAGRTVVEEGPDGMKRVNTPKLTMLNSAALAQYDDRLGELERRIASIGGRAA